MKFLKFTGKVLAGCLIALIFGILVVAGLLWLSANVDWSKTGLVPTIAPTITPTATMEPLKTGFGELIQTTEFKIYPVGGFVTLEGLDNCTKLSEKGLARISVVLFVNKYKESEPKEIYYVTLTTPDGKTISSDIDSYGCAYSIIDYKTITNHNFYFSSDWNHKFIYGNTDTHLYNFVINKKVFEESNGEYHLKLFLDKTVDVVFGKNELEPYETDNGLIHGLILLNPQFK